MKMLIERIQPYFEIVIFPQDMILNDPIESWPIVDVLMGWYSDGFNYYFSFIIGYPLDKAIAYVDYRKPYALNDLRMQKISFLFLSYNVSFMCTYSLIEELFTKC